MLRKRIFTVSAMLLIAAVLAASVAGCTFIRENEYRAANEAYATVSHNGYTLEITYNEFIDYFNTMGYFYVNSYGYSVEDALDLCISSKIQQKYLLTEAMVYLSDPDSVGQERVAALSNLPVKTPSDALTPAEYYAAVYAVSNSMITSAEDIAEESRQTEYTRIMNAVSSRDVSGIDFSDETKDYFETFFHAGAGCYVGQQLDLERVKIVVKYDDGKVSDPFVVPTAQYTTAFTSEATSDYSERTEEKEFVISFDESVTGSDGEETTEKHTLTYDYDLIYPRETKAEPEEETDYTTVTIGDFDPVSRYAKDSEIPDEIKQACRTISPIEEMEAAEKKGDSYMADAWRRVNENLNSANKMLTDLYASQFESAVLSALQAELYNQADRAFAATDAAVAAEYKYLYATAKDSYTGAADDDKAAFIEAVGEGTDSLYYYPAIDDIGNYYYVYQILFSFTDEQAAFIEEELGDDEEAIEEFTQLIFRRLKTQPSDPGYDAENYDPEDAEAKEPFGEEELVSDVIGKLESVLGKIYAGQALTEAEDGYDYAAEQLDTPEKRSAAAIDVFLDYLYRYNDDPGIFNNAYGYLMTADPEDSGWVDAFNELGDAVFKVENAGLGSGTGLVGNAFGADGKLAWKASNYGIHLMMVSATPFKGVTGELVLPATDADIVAYLKGRTNPDTGESMYGVITDGLKSENRTTVYNAFISGVPTDLFTRDKKNKLVLNDSVKDWLSINAKKIKNEIYKVYLG